MAEMLSPLGPEWRPGVHARAGQAPCVALSEPRPGSIVQVAAFPGAQTAAIAAIRAATGLAVPQGAGSGVSGEEGSAFGIGPGRFLVVDAFEGLARKLAAALPAGDGTVTDLSHGRVALRVEGPRSEWVLQKLFAIDLSARAFPVGAGRSMQHHDILAQIQRTGPDRFDLYVFRSLARSFWQTLCHAAEEVGYEVR